jgi:hypothetical protein
VVNGRAQEEINVQFHTFQDTRGVTVLSPTVDLAKDFTERTGLRAKFGVDTISAASDSCARCHPEGANAARLAGSVSVSRKYGDTKLSLGGELSQENFYRATTLLTSVSRSLNQANTTIAGGYSFSYNQPVLHPGKDSEKQYVNDAYVSVTQNLSRTTVAQIGYEIAGINGYQSNPFLRAPVNGVMMVGQAPDHRTRQTFTARLRQALPASTYLEADYRHYTDDWSIGSNALSVGLSHYFTRQVLASFTYRWYTQTGAYFYQPAYFGSPEYFTGDFRLMPFDSGTYTGRLVIVPREGVLGLRRGTGLTFQYERYHGTNGFDAAIFTFGLRIPLHAGGSP